METSICPLLRVKQSNRERFKKRNRHVELQNHIQSYKSIIFISNLKKYSFFCSLITRTFILICGISPLKERSNNFLPLCPTYSTTRVVQAFQGRVCFHGFSMFLLECYDVGLCLADSLGQLNLLFGILQRNKMGQWHGRYMAGVFWWFVANYPQETMGK